MALFPLLSLFRLSRASATESDLPQASSGEAGGADWVVLNSSTWLDLIIDEFPVISSDSSFLVASTDSTRTTLTSSNEDSDLHISVTLLDSPLQNRIDDFFLVPPSSLPVVLLPGEDDDGELVDSSDAISGFPTEDEVPTPPPKGEDAAQPTSALPASVRDFDVQIFPIPAVSDFPPVSGVELFEPAPEEDDTLDDSLSEEAEDPATPEAAFPFVVFPEEAAVVVQEEQAAVSAAVSAEGAATEGAREGGAAEEEGDGDTEGGETEGGETEGGVETEEYSSTASEEFVSPRSEEGSEETSEESELQSLQKPAVEGEESGLRLRRGGRKWVGAGEKGEKKNVQSVWRDKLESFKTDLKFLSRKLRSKTQ